MKISVITVCFNAERFIKDAVYSVANQSYRFKEHIIVDGASNDCTLQVLNAMRSDGMIFSCVSERDTGVYDAMNKGIHRASGDVIGFLNSDDIYHHDDVLRDVANVFADENVEVCFGDLEYVKRGDVSSVIRVWRSNVFEKGMFAKGWSPAHPTFFIRRSAIDKVGMYDLSITIGNDVEWMMRALEVYDLKSVYLPDFLIRMRVGGISNSSIVGIISQNINIIAALKKYKLWQGYCAFLCKKILNRFRQYFGGC